MKRSFTVVSIARRGGRNLDGVAGGRYVSSTPMDAARKAFSKASGAIGAGEVTLHVTIMETTKDGNNKQFSYTISRTKLSQPKQVSRGGAIVEYKYAIISRRMIS